MKISTVTRRDIVDAINIQGIRWSGRLEEPEFLSRIYDLSIFPSKDNRFSDAGGDIWQHRVNNYDWEDDWVFYDTRFSLLNGDDEIFLRFLCETVHPIVRSDATEAEQLVQLYNEFLREDGYQLAERTRISGRPVYVGRFIGAFSLPGLPLARETLLGIDAGYIAQQITRMEVAVINDPGLAIGTAKELIETCCKTILQERNVEFSESLDLPKLVKLTSSTLELTPSDIPEKAKAYETIRKILSSFATITQGIAELRNQYGTGHGKSISAKGLTSRHAKLAVGAASTLAVFLLETHLVRKQQTPA